MTSSRIAGAVVPALIAAALVSAPAQAMTEQELCQLYLDVVEDAVADFEPLWVDDSKRIPNSGFWDFRKYDTWLPKWYAEVVTVPGAGQIVYCYSVLLSETTKETFTDKKIPRKTLIDHAVKALRWCCLTSAYVKNGYDFLPARDEHQFYKGKKWRRKLGYRADEMGWLTVGAARLWDQLDDETKGLLEQVMIGGAQPERLVRSWRSGGQGGNHDVVKQDLASTIGAAYLFPQRDDHKKYQDIIRGNGIDLVATVHDQACKAKADGKTIAQWSADGVELFRKQVRRPDWTQIWNLYPDYSSDHHGWCQVWYGCDLIFEGRSYIELLSHIRKMPVPAVYTYPGNGFDGVLDWVKTTCLPEGEPASVHGMEYDAYYGSGLLAYCYGAVIKRDPVSARLERQAAQLLRRHTRATRLYDYHRNCYAKAASCYLLHKIHGPGPKPLPPAEAWRARNGNTHYRWQQCLVHRSDNKFASWSWGTISRGRWCQMAGFVVPARNGGGADEPLMYLLQNSLVGTTSTKWQGAKPKGAPADVVYRHTCSDDGMSTAGVISEAGADRYQAFFALDGGPCVLFTQVRLHQPGKMYFQGVPLFFYVRPGLTSSRTYCDAKGTQSLETAATRKSPWWCVNDRLGVATVGGSGTVRIKRVVGMNWARTSAYKDKADAIYTGTIDEVDVKAGGLGVDLTTVVYTETPHDLVAKASGLLEKCVLVLPNGWKGVIVPDAKRHYLAISNLWGQEPQVKVRCALDEGAPVLSSETIVRGGTATATIHLERLGSFAEPIECYIKVPDGRIARARRLTPNRYMLEPEGTKALPVVIRLPGAAGLAYEIIGYGVNVKGTVPKEEQLSATVPGMVTIELKGKARQDHVAPAVEITDVVHRVDGQVRIEVAARDRSGIASVELYCDGKPLARRAAGDYIWVHRPGNGAHTYHAVATDASPQKNKRASFKRTLVVKRDEARP